MAQVLPGRYTAQTDKPFVAFLIGMRINRFVAFTNAFTKRIPMVMAIGPMIRTLYEHPESGFLGARTLLSWRGVTVVQYWRSFEDVERFARDPGDLHMKAGRRFNAAVGYKTHSVGIWHETFAVEPGHFEAFYGNMPITGLAAATSHVPLNGGRDTARERMRPSHASIVESSAQSQHDKQAASA
jgi:hypothetical protein